ncbi:MAG TPA: hypothetical protein VFC18_01990, partial [Burkholderiales bacterium]|nr:hypothetical protein [Burkholderiales bacterium]
AAEQQTVVVHPPCDTPATAFAYPPTQMPQSVTYVPGMICHPSARKDTVDIERLEITSPAAFCFSATIAGLLRDPARKAFSAASIRFEGSAAE